MPYKNLTYSRTNLPMPPDIDFRTNKGNDPIKSWLILQQTRAEALKVYYLIVTQILSRIEGISIPELKEILMYQYLIDLQTIEKAIEFLKNSNDIEWLSATDTVNHAVMFRAPRIPVSQTGVSSPYWINKK